MKLKAFIFEAIVLILVVDLFYQGIYKVAYWGNFSSWLEHAPLLTPISIPLSFIIPLLQIAISLSLLSALWRIRALYIIMVSCLIYIIWIACAHFFTHRIFFPFHGIGYRPTWMGQTLISLGTIWLSFIVIALSNLLRNNPVPAGRKRTAPIRA